MMTSYDYSTNALVKYEDEKYLEQFVSEIFDSLQHAFTWSVSQCDLGKTCEGVITNSNQNFKLQCANLEGVENRKNLK